MALQAHAPRVCQMPSPAVGTRQVFPASRRGCPTEKQQMARAKLVVRGSRGRNSELLLSDDHYKATMG